MGENWVYGSGDDDDGQWTQLDGSVAFAHAYPPGSGPPSIDHISPTSIAYGAGDGYGSPYGYVGVYGTNLDSGGDSCVTVSFGTCYWASDTQVNIQYDESVGTGTYQISVTDDVGASSNSVPFTIAGDSTPSISGVTPASPWQAGAVYQNFSLTGSGFGSTGDSSDVGFSCCVDSFALANWSDGLITGTVTVDANAGGQTVTIAVQSTGYNGFNFQAGQGQSSQGGTTVQVQLPPPLSRIYLSNSDVTNTTQYVTVGQQVALSGVNIGGPGTGPTWGIGGSYVGGFSPTSSGPGIQGVNLNSQSVAFYFTAGGTVNVTFSLTAPGGGVYTGTTTFNVASPNANLLVTYLGASGTVVDTACGSLGVHYGGCLNHTAGISFGVVPDPFLGGSYELIQVVDTATVYADSATIRDDGGCADGAADGTFVYSTGLTAVDAPFQGLSASRNQYTIDMGFHMFLLFQPSAGGIYVPIKVNPWGWSVIVTNSGGTWPTSSVSAPSGPVAQATAYPNWTYVCMPAQ